MRDAIYNKIYCCKEYMLIVKDLLLSKEVQKMENYFQHGSTTCLQHCLLVSYYSYKVCKFLSLDAKSAARAGLLHDLFLYDWHIDKRFSHSYLHPKIALYNAKKSFKLNAVESDMIDKHMFPLAFTKPRYLETVVILLVDKYCAAVETVCR